MTAETLAQSCRAMQGAGLATLTQTIVLLDLARAERTGERHTASTLVKALDMPISSVSRVVWDFVQMGLVTHVPHATDRRVKVIRVDMKRMRKVLPS